MALEERIIARFSELGAQAQKLPLRTASMGVPSAQAEPFYAWISSALNLIQGVFGKESPHYERLQSEVSSIKNNYVDQRQLEACRGIFFGAKSDADGAHIFKLQSEISGEIFGDIVAAADHALGEGHHAVACVLACAALEDALKRYAAGNGLNVDGKSMEDVVNSLKAAGLVTGAQKALLGAMPKIRNFAMHGDWGKITPQDAGSVIGFVRQFLLTNFT
jgi:hypothetical protein